MVAVAPARRSWSTEELTLLETCIEQGLSDRAIAARLGRTPNAVMIKRKRSRIPSRSALHLSARKVARLLGLSCAKVVVQWLMRGWLCGRRGQRRGPHRSWWISEEALLQFLEDARYWHAWSPARITDPALRDWAIEMRASTTYLTTGEVARRLCVTVKTVHVWIKRGLLPAVRWGNWRIRASDLDGFVVPCERLRPQVRIRRFMPDEDAQLRALRANGATWVEIARSLGRATSSVHGRLQRLAVSERQ